MQGHSLARCVNKSTAPCTAFRPASSFSPPESEEAINIHGRDNECSRSADLRYTDDAIHVFEFCELCLCPSKCNWLGSSFPRSATAR